MSQEPKTDPDLTLLASARALADNGHATEARAMYRNVLKQTSPSDPDQATMRIAALAGMIELAASNGQPQRTTESVGFLREEIDYLLGCKLPDACLDEIAVQLNTLCEQIGARRRWTEVKQISRMVVRLSADERPESQAHRIRGLNNLGSALLGESRYDDAIHVWLCAIKDYAPKLCPAGRSPLATIHNNLGELRRLQCRLPLAVEHHQQAVELRTACFADDNPLVRQSRFNYAQVLADSKLHTSARAQLKSLVDVLPPLDENATAETLRANLLNARVLLDEGQWTSAETLIDQLVRSIGRMETRPPRFELEAHLLRLEAALLLEKQNVIRSESERIAELLQTHKATETILEGRYQYLFASMRPDMVDEPVDTREAHAQHAVRIFRARLPRNHYLVAEGVFQLARIFVTTQRGQRATQTANSAMAIYEQGFGERSVAMLHALVRVAEIVLTRLQFRNVRSLMKLALQISSEHEDVPPLITFQIYDLLAQMYSGLQKRKPAAYFARAAWQQAADSLEFPPQVESPLADRALEWSSAVGHDAAAIPAARRRIELLTAAHHSGHPLTAEATEDLARLCEKAGRYEQAAETLASVLTVRCGELGEDSDEAVSLLEYAADLNRRAGRDDEAEALTQQVLQITQKASHVLSDLL